MGSATGRRCKRKASSVDGNGEAQERLISTLEKCIATDASSGNEFDGYGKLQICQTTLLSRSDFLVTQRWFSF